MQLFKIPKDLFCVSLTLCLQAVVLAFKIFFPFFISLLPGWENSMSVIKSSTRLSQESKFILGLNENPCIIRADWIAFNNEAGIKLFPFRNFYSIPVSNFLCLLSVVCGVVLSVR